MSNSLVAAFLDWFYVIAPRQILRLGGNFLAWGWQFFSIGYFIPHLFDPWRKDITSYGIGFDFKRWLHAMGWNAISRVIGAVIRLVVMGLGVLVEGGILFLAAFLLILWYLLPLVILALLLLGNYSLFR